MQSTVWSHTFLIRSPVQLQLTSLPLLPWTYTGLAGKDGSRPGVLWSKSASFILCPDGSHNHFPPHLTTALLSPTDKNGKPSFLLSSHLERKLSHLLTSSGIENSPRSHSRPQVSIGGEVSITHPSPWSALCRAPEMLVAWRMLERFCSKAEMNYSHL